MKIENSTNLQQMISWYSLACGKCRETRGWGYWANFLHSFIFPIFQKYQNINYLYNITIISDMRRRGWAVEATDNYERDFKYLI